MADFDRRTVTGMRADAYAVDEGLRAFMLRVYNYMAAGLAITGLTAYGTYQVALTNPAVRQALYGSPLKYVVMFAPIVLVFVLAARVNRMSIAAAQGTFWFYAALMGVSLSSIFFVFKLGSIAQVFFITSASFGALSLYGYTTKKDLSGWGSFLFMGLIGILLASIVNMFLHAPALQFAISLIGVLVFAGLTAYDTQTIKEVYEAGDSDVVAGRKAILGALNLYLDFVNLFIMLLQLLGNRE